MSNIRFGQMLMVAQNTSERLNRLSSWRVNTLKKEVFKNLFRFNIKFARSEKASGSFFVQVVASLGGHIDSADDGYRSPRPNRPVTAGIAVTDRAVRSRRALFGSPQASGPTHRAQARSR